MVLSLTYVFFFNAAVVMYYVKVSILFFKCVLRYVFLLATSYAPYICTYIITFIHI